MLRSGGTLRPSSQGPVKAVNFASFHGLSHLINLLLLHILQLCFLDSSCGTSTRRRGPPVKVREIIGTWKSGGKSSAPIDKQRALSHAWATKCRLRSCNQSHAQVSQGPSAERYLIILMIGSPTCTAAKTWIVAFPPLQTGNLPYGQGSKGSIVQGKEFSPKYCWIVLRIVPSCDPPRLLLKLDCFVQSHQGDFDCIRIPWKPQGSILITT